MAVIRVGPCEEKISAPVHEGKCGYGSGRVEEPSTAMVPRPENEALGSNFKRYWLNDNNTTIVNQD
jgi:hypothetical protein